MRQIQEYLKQGWMFVYDPETAFIGIEHPQGGSQSLCDLRHGLSKSVRDAFGRELETFLNSEHGPVRKRGLGLGERAMKAFIHEASKSCGRITMVAIPSGQGVTLEGLISLATRLGFRLGDKNKLTYLVR